MEHATMTSAETQRGAIATAAQLTDRMLADVMRDPDYSTLWPYLEREALARLLTRSA